MNNEKLVELIKEAQGNRSQNEFALHSEVSSATITKILKSERFPSPKILKKLADKAYNGVTYEQLMQAAGYVDSNIDETEEDYTNYFPIRLIKLREDMGKTKKEVAQDLNLAESTYGKYELGHRQPSLGIMTNIADYFNVSLDYLMCRSDKPELVLNDSLLGKYFDGYDDIGEDIILVRENNKKFVIMSFEKYLRLKGNLNSVPLS